MTGVAIKGMSNDIEKSYSKTAAGIWHAELWPELDANLQVHAWVLLIDCGAEAYLRDYGDFQTAKRAYDGLRSYSDVLRFARQKGTSQAL